MEDESSGHDDQLRNDSRGNTDNEIAMRGPGLDGSEQSNALSSEAIARDRSDPPFASLSVEDGRVQRSPQENLLPERRSARTAPARGPLASLSLSTASHQSQLRKQAHVPAPRLSSRVASAAVEGSHFSRERGASSFSLPSLRNDRAAAARPLPLHSFASIGNSPPEEPLPDSPTNLNSGWSVVESTRGVAGGAPPCQRSLHAAAVLNDCMYVFGGYDGHARVNDFHCFSFADKRWSPVLPSANSGRAPAPRDRHVAVVYGNSFYVFGTCLLDVDVLKKIVQNPALSLDNFFSFQVDLTGHREFQISLVSIFPPWRGGR